MKTSVTLATAAIVFSLSSLATAAAQTVECNVKSNRAASGASVKAGFDIKSGRACTYGDSSGGMVRSANVAQQAQHGSVRLLNSSSFEYRSKPGYAASDAFVIEATGRDTFGTGTSVLTYNVNVR